MTSRRSMLLGLVLGAFLSVLGLNVAYSQVPRSISYQGLLVKNNQPVNALVNLHVKIYDAAGTTLYEESYNQVQISNGIFNVLLGGNSGTLPASLKFDEQYYLGINVDNTGEVTPKTPFVAAPYALNAQTVGGIGVSVTPQAGMLLPLDQSGKLPKSVLPTAVQTINTINLMPGDASGNIQIVAGNNITVTDIAPGQIRIAATGGASGITTVVAGPGLIGGGSTPSVTLQIAPNGITSSMLGTSVVRGINLDQNIPQLGLYQDALGQLNVGKDATLNYVVVPNTPAGVPHGIGLNLSNPNTWLALQTFNAGITVNGTTTLVGPVNITGTTNQTGNFNLTGNLTVNGTAEPLAAPNGASYEITNNGDLLVTGSVTTRGNTYIGVGPTNNANTMGLAGSSANTITGTTNNVTGTVGNNIQSPANNVGTTNAGSVNTIGAAGSSTNTMTGASNAITGTTGNTITGGTNTVTGTVNTITGSTSNNMQAPINNIGTTQALGNTNTIGTAGTSANLMQGVSNNVQSPTNNIGTTNAGSVNTIGNAATSTNNMLGATNNSQANTINIGTTVGGSATNIGNSLTSTNTMVGATNTINATNNNMGTNANSTNTIGAAGTSTNTMTGVNNTITASTLTTFNGNVLHNGLAEPNAASAGAVSNYELRNLGDFQNNGATNLIGNVFMNQTLSVAGLTSLNGGLTIIGPLTQSGGNAAIAGGATNSFGTAGNNTIGGAGSNNTMTGVSNTLTATTSNNISAPTNTITGNTTSTGGTFTTTGNSFIGTTSTNNTIGNPTAVNTITGTTNNYTATTANNFTGDIIQVSGRVSIAPSAGTTNNFGNAASQINNYGTGASTTNNIGTGAGSVTNIGTVSGGGISTTNIGNQNVGTGNNINGLTTLSYTGDQTYVRIAGGVASCAGIFPTGAQSELLVNGDGFFDGTIAACRMNIFGAAPSCITNLNTTNFGSCAGGVVPINLISSILGVGTVDMTNMRNIQVTNNIQTNLTLTIGVPGTNATNVTSSNPGPASVAQQTPTVSGKLPTYQTYQLDLAPGTGPNGGGAVTFNAATTAGLINFDINDGLMVTYRTHNLAVPAGALYVTSVPGVSVTVESSAANDNNRVQLTILRD